MAGRVLLLKELFVRLGVLDDTLEGVLADLEKLLPVALLEKLPERDRLFCVLSVLVTLGVLAGLCEKVLLRLALKEPLLLLMVEPMLLGAVLRPFVAVEPALLPKLPDTEPLFVPPDTVALLLFPLNEPLVLLVPKLLLPFCVLPLAVMRVELLALLSLFRFTLPLFQWSRIPTWLFEPLWKSLRRGL